MDMWEKPHREDRHHQRRRTPSFSSTLLDAIYHSIDESSQEQQNLALHHRKKNNPIEAEEEIAGLRRAIMVEKWMESYSTSSRRSRHVNSDSSSSNDSSIFSETEYSATKSTPRSCISSSYPRHQAYVPEATTPKHEGRFTRTKSRALKMYGDLKKVKQQPISPGRKIANFLNSIFTPRTLKKREGMEDWTSVKKSRSVKEPSQTLASRSCLNRTILQPPSSSSSSSRNKSKRSVRFCPVSTVIVDEDCQPIGQKSIYNENDYDYNDPELTPLPKINSQFLKKNIDSLRASNYEEQRKLPKKSYALRGFYEDDSDDEDGNSCTSSDLFELENIGNVGINGYHGGGIHHRDHQDLPVYGTTNVKVNQAIANSLCYVA
ncbi:OLC1v1037830C1 [Oldenlandia corymbosa var. corymbosa]|uniref:OLC1v1037830C1 n=1 Tax=Oldenlandia corymbosa var. corymbosa TaxID=529605 RepID=A0AAV1CYI0_OLDCO|nr:OLC1v1037830C1 [Oldenlandia corymbosa var. corymbosa]